MTPVDEYDEDERPKRKKVECIMGSQTAEAVD